MKNFLCHKFFLIENEESFDNRKKEFLFGWELWKCRVNLHYVSCSSSCRSDSIVERSVFVHFRAEWFDLYCSDGIDHWRSSTDVKKFFLDSMNFLLDWVDFLGWQWKICSVSWSVHQFNNPLEDEIAFFFAVLRLFHLTKENKSPKISDEFMQVNEQTNINCVRVMLNNILHFVSRELLLICHSWSKTLPRRSIDEKSSRSVGKVAALDNFLMFFSLIKTTNWPYDVFNQCPRKLKKRSLRGYGGHGYT